MEHYDRIHFKHVCYIPVVCVTVCIPHFLEHGARRLPDGEVVVQDNFIEDNFNYKVVYYSIVDPLLRYDTRSRSHWINILIWTKIF